MATGTHLMTADELARLPGDQRCELINGERIMKTPAGYGHGRIALEIARRMGNHVRTHRLGTVCAGDTGFVITHEPDTVRAPDAAFVRAGRSSIHSSGYFDGPPDLAVEVVSRDDRPKEVEAKTRQWLEAGTQLVWVVWPQTRCVAVHRAEQPARILHEADTLEGGDVLPGFACPVAELFD